MTFLFKIFPLSDPWCVTVSPGREKCLALKITKHKIKEEEEEVVVVVELSRSVTTTRKIQYLAKISFLKSRWTNTQYISIIRPTLQNYKIFLK